MKLWNHDSRRHPVLPAMVPWQILPSTKCDSLGTRCGSRGPVKINPFIPGFDTLLCLGAWWRFSAGQGVQEDNFLRDGGGPGAGPGREYGQAHVLWGRALTWGGDTEKAAAPGGGLDVALMRGEQTLWTVSDAMPKLGWFLRGWFPQQARAVSAQLCKGERASCLRDWQRRVAARRSLPGLLGSPSHVSYFLQPPDKVAGTEIWFTASIRSP